MPFRCGLEHGHIKVSPSAETSYAIVGKRDVAAVTACQSPRSSSCRTMIVHRFVISCGEAGVAWMRVAAAIRQAAAAPAWIDQGRFNMVVPVHHAAAARVPCMERPTYALGRTELKRRVAYAGNCETRRNDFDHVVLPAGFAPVEELGARLELAAATEKPSEPGREHGSAFTPAAAGDGETIVARGDPDAIVDPIPGLEPYDAEVEPAVASDKWVTVVRTERGSGVAASASDGPSRGPWAWLLAAMALAAAAGLVCAGSTYAWPVPLLAFAPGLARIKSQLRANRQRYRWDAASAPENFMNAGAAVQSLLAQTEQVVEQLKHGGALREVLQSELKLVRQALKSVEAAAKGRTDEERLSATRSAGHFRALVRELERIRRIAESAATSLSGARQVGSVPRTTSEAYDILGVNPDVSEGVLKKIVDALRMSWHPDHARDDEDRMVREDRMRQINIAWDLINGAREVA
jgi:hypothetical protein